MIKIERIDSTARPTYVRNGLRQPLFAFQLVNEEEFTSIELTEGSILYSVNESEVNTIQANTSAVVSTNPTEVSTNPTEVSSNPTEVSTKPVIVPATPKIIQPKKSGK